MKLHLLGTTGYHPNNHRHTACMMLPSIGVVLDAGTAMFRVREHLTTSTLDIFLTHAHLDHVVGLTYLFDVLHEKQVDRVTVHAEPDKIQAIREHLFSEALFPVTPPCEFVPLDQQISLGEGAKLTHFPLVHPGGAVGYRLDWPDRSMAYVTDTTADEAADYVKLIQGVDLLVHECYFPDGWESWAAKTGHSCISPVARVAKAADVGRLVLVHLNPLVETEPPMDVGVAQAIFPETILATDEMVIEF
jgi:ribonuclease Z